MTPAALERRVDRRRADYLRRKSIVVGSRLCDRLGCGAAFEVTAADPDRRFCSQVCSNRSLGHDVRVAGGRGRGRQRQRETATSIRERVAALAFGTAERIARCDPREHARLIALALVEAHRDGLDRGWTRGYRAGRRA